jgi:preprotein translocase subunit SecF
MSMFDESNIDFVGRRGIAAVISLIMILVGLASLVVKHGPAYSIDFTGGSLLQIQFVEPVPVEVVRAKLQEVGFSAAQIQRFGEPNELLIRIPDTGDDEAIETVKESLRQSWPDLELRREERVGPKIGGELRAAALEAIVFALVLILVYITIRFEFRFAVAAIVALVHDVLITLGVFSLIGHEISLAVIAAFLTIVGYSLNDTIVVFDRIRENLRVPARTAHDAILNRSVNQSLSRTIITSGTTILVVMILLIFGGEVLQDFAFALVVGIVVGTYSSIFIATPVLVEWQKRWPRKVK